jgi:hypothetical protein
VRSDKNRRNFEVFARFFGRIGHIWTLLPLEREIFFGVRATLKDSLCTWEGYESSGTPFIFDRSARKWISVVGPNDLKISARYLNALLVDSRSSFRKVDLHVDLISFIIIGISLRTGRYW